VVSINVFKASVICSVHSSIDVYVCVCVCVCDDQIQRKVETDHSVSIDTVPIKCRAVFCCGASRTPSAMNKVLP